MSILKTFDVAGEEIIRPGQMISKSDNFPEVLVSGFSRSVTDLAAQLPDAVQIDTLRAGMELPVIAVRRGACWNPRILGKLPVEEKERYLRIAPEIAQRLA